MIKVKIKLKIKMNGCLPLTLRRSSKACSCSRKSLMTVLAYFLKQQLLTTMSLTTVKLSKTVQQAVERAHPLVATNIVNTSIGTPRRFRRRRDHQQPYHQRVCGRSQSCNINVIRLISLVYLFSS